MTSLTAAQLVQFAALSGFTFSAADLEPLRPAVERALDALQRLETLPVQAIDPAVQYRVL